MNRFGERKHFDNRGNCCGNHGRWSCNRDENCKKGNGKGKRRELFEEKFSQYLKTVNLPEFENEDAYLNWSQTEEGQLHKQNIEKIWLQVDNEIPWGGKRQNAGRPKQCVRKISYTRRLSQDVLDKLKAYARENNLSETEALEKAIENLS